MPITRIMVFEFRGSGLGSVMDLGSILGFPLRS